MVDPGEHAAPEDPQTKADGKDNIETVSEQPFLKICDKQLNSGKHAIKSVALLLTFSS